MRFAFAGTPQFGAWVLGDVLERGLRPELVISQPDRPAGRGRRPTPPPTVAAALRAGLDVFQTADINDPTLLARLHHERVDSLVVAAFGQMLRRPLLEGLLCVNVHASLLPSYRGAAPVARALMAGEGETGVSIMRMSAGLDEGPVASVTRISVGMADTAGEVGRVLALLGALGTERVFTGLADGTLRWAEQEGQATYAAKLTPADRRFDPHHGVRALHDRVRALAPDIGCDAVTGQGLKLKVWRTWPTTTTPLSDPGTCRAAGQRLQVDCADGVLELLAVQPAGKRPMHVAEFLRGYAERLGGTVGPPPAADKED